MRPGPCYPPLTIAAQRHAEIVEQLRRISTGIEIVVAQNDRALDQLREIVARFEAALK